MYCANIYLYSQKNSGIIKMFQNETLFYCHYTKGKMNDNVKQLKIKLTVSFFHSTITVMLEVTLKWEKKNTFACRFT